MLCHLSILVGLVLIGWRHFDNIQAGMSAATFYLLLPYAYMLLPDSPDARGVPGRWDDVWPGTPEIAGDHGLPWATQVFQLGCHQDLSLDDLAAIAGIVRETLRT